MLSLTVSQNGDQPLTDQIVAGIKRQIDDRHLRPGTKLPSIRDFAETYKVSRFTVVEAYDRLVAMGYLQSRRGAGFYTSATLAPAEAAHPAPVRQPQAQRAAGLAHPPTAGGGREHDPCGRPVAAEFVARRSRHPPEPQRARAQERRLSARIRAPVRLSAAARASRADAGRARHHRSVQGQILLTQGTSQALELVIRYLLKPGDAALVDDPGYYNMFGNLRLQGVEMLAVPRNPDGPDVAVLEKLAAAHRPKVYFTQSVMQNPTGTDMSPHVAFKVLQAAERHNFTVVEDDIFCDLQVKTTPRLATLDQLNRVIYARSFSKTLSGSLRVGFLACTQDIANELADIKMLTSITTSQFTERLDLSDAGGWPLPQISVALARAAGRGAPQCRARLRTHRAGIVRGARGRHVRLGAIPAYRRLASAGGGVAARRHHACARRRLPSASRTLAVDAVQRRRLRGPARAGLAAAAGVEHGDVAQPAETDSPVTRGVNRDRAANDSFRCNYEVHRRYHE